MSVIPYVQYLINESRSKPINNEISNLSRFLQTIYGSKVQNKAISTPEIEVCSTFLKPGIKKLFTELLSYYKQNYMTKYSNFFHDCLLVMLRDFEICPVLAPLKDCYIIYSIIVQSDF